VSEDEAAERLYGEAIDRLGRTRVRGELARAHLLYGEWLRRERRRTDARGQLRTAHEMFTAMGMEAFAERAARELQATGQRLSSRTVETSGEMTAQEAQIVRLVRDGLSNSEVGARLFLSPRTVEWHLRRIFGKLQSPPASNSSVEPHHHSTPGSVVEGCDRRVDRGPVTHGPAARAELVPVRHPGGFTGTTAAPPRIV
jgi:DNA-binding CsgD family transcriptional regulator